MKASGDRAEGRGEPVLAPAAIRQGKKRLRGALAVAALAALTFSCGSDHGHAPRSFTIASTAPGGGSLTAARPVPSEIELAFGGSIAGLDFYSATEPSLAFLADDRATRSLFALDEGTSVRLELVSAEPGVEIQIADTFLLVPGQSVVIGQAPEVTEQPEWLIVVTQGVVPTQRQLSVRFTSDDPAYSPSAEIPLTLVPIL